MAKFNTFYFSNIKPHFLSLTFTSCSADYVIRLRYKGPLIYDKSDFFLLTSCIIGSTETEINSLGGFPCSVDEELSSAHYVNKYIFYK